MNKYDCIYKKTIETDYDIISGHSTYEDICTKKEKCGERCFNCYCKYREQLENKQVQYSGNTAACQAAITDPNPVTCSNMAL